jgi:hypothetical protein
LPNHADRRTAHPKRHHDHQRTSGDSRLEQTPRSARRFLGHDSAEVIDENAQLGAVGDQCSIHRLAELLETEVAAPITLGETL